MRVGSADPGGARAPSTSFVGRRDELASLRALLGASRVLTITGPGGSGKTRLVEELVAHVTRSFDRQVAVAYLAGAGAPEEVAEVVMAAVGLRGGGDPHEALAAYLASRRFLLLLDNCEHLRDAVAELVVHLQRTCPGVVIIATSRRALDVPGEQLFAIQGLADTAALALFIDRIRLVAPSFALTEAQWPIAVELCARLEGMPLAIELAAARLRHLGLAELADRLGRRLGDLGSPESLAPARQRTLRGAIDWSHDLLDEPQQIAWRRLSVFADGFTLAAATSVAGFEPLAPEDVERLVGELVDRSMVAFDVAVDRYRLIEAMREYARERLEAADEAALTAGRHRAWMLDRALDLDQRWWGPDQAVLLDAMAADAANLRAALESARAAGENEVGLRISTSAMWYWMTRASHAEAERWFLPFLDRESDPALAAKSYLAAAWISQLSGKPGDHRGFLDHVAALTPGASDVALPGYVAIVRGLQTISDGDLPAGDAIAREVLLDSDADPICHSWARIELEMVAFFGGDLDASRRLASDAIRICEAAGESWSRVSHLHMQAVAMWLLGDPAGARPLLLDSLRIDRRLDDIWHRAWSIETLGWVTTDLGRDEHAARLLGIAQACWAFTGSNIWPAWQGFHDTAIATLRKRLGEPRLVSALLAGRSMDRSRAMAYALEDGGAGGSDALVAPDPVARARVSSRELEVAALVAAGLSNRQIGEQLYLSVRTVDTHVKHLMDKLGVSSRAEIAAWQSRAKPSGA